MIFHGAIQKISRKDNDTQLVIDLPVNIRDYYNGVIKQGCAVQLSDGRELSDKQRGCIYATIDDIANHFGWTLDAMKDYLKTQFLIGYNLCDISFGNCSVEQANDFITFLIDFCMYYNVPISSKLWDRSDDKYTMQVLCLIHKKCAICGDEGERHELSGSRIGMGNDRLKVDMTGREQICLCREHHKEIHMDELKFLKNNELFGIKNEEWKKYERIFSNRNVRVIKDSLY